MDVIKKTRILFEFDSVISWVFWRRPIYNEFKRLFLELVKRLVADELSCQEHQETVYCITYGEGWITMLQTTIGSHCWVQIVWPSSMLYKGISTDWVDFNFFVIEAFVAL